MSQADIGNITTGQSGPDFFDNKLEPWRNALHSGHSGSSRPSYAIAKMTWLDTTTSPIAWKYYDGTNDITFGLIDEAADTFGLVAATIGANTTQRHSVPAVASDTVALLSATQTMAAKTFTNTCVYNGRTGGAAPAAGTFGQLLEARLDVASATALTTGVSKNVTSVALTAGCWDITGFVGTITTGTTSTTRVQAAISAVSATLPAADPYYGYTQITQPATTNANQLVPIGAVRVNISATTTYYLVAASTFTVSTTTAYGAIRATRIA